MQRALMRYFAPENKSIVIKALRIAGRNDLIGSGKNCLVQADNKPDRKPVRKADNRNSRGKINEKQKRRYK